MTRLEFAQALRERFAKIRWQWPELIRKSQYMGTDAWIAGHLRCAHCRRLYVPMTELDAFLAPFEKPLDVYWTLEKLAIETHPDCIAKVKAIEAGIMAERPEQ